MVFDGSNMAFDGPKMAPDRLRVAQDSLEACVRARESERPWESLGV